MKFRSPFLSVVALATAATLAACSPPADDKASSSDASSATSASDLGGMDALVKAAEAEGTLNVIALPPDWANYGAVISGFEAKYDITVKSDQPDAASQDEINAADQLKGTDRAPDESLVCQPINTTRFTVPGRRREYQSEVARLLRIHEALFERHNEFFRRANADKTRAAHVVTVANKCDCLVGTDYLVAVLHLVSGNR